MRSENEIREMIARCRVKAAEIERNPPPALAGMRAELRLMSAMWLGRAHILEWALGLADEP